MAHDRAKASAPDQTAELGQLLERLTVRVEQVELELRRRAQASSQDQMVSVGAAVALISALRGDGS